MIIDYNELVRELSNGILTVAALLLSVLFAYYLLINRKTMFANNTTLAALGLFVLMFGHTIRSGGIWIGFLIMQGRIPNNVYLVSPPYLVSWMNYSWIWFTVAVILVVLGDTMMIYLFAPLRWRWWILSLGIPACFLVPVLISVGVRL
jgi:hypothetical protein